VFLAVLLVAAAMAVSVRHGMFALLQLLALAGYSWLQFERRHVFYLEFVGVLAALTPLWLAWWYATAGRRMPLGDAFVRAGVGVVLFIATPIAAVSALRAYQTVHAKHLFEQYIAAATTSTPVIYDDAGEGTLVARWPHVARSAYYRIDIDWRSQAALVAVGLRYRANAPPDLSSVMTIDVKPGINRLFFPAYSNPPALDFDGVEIAAPVRKAVRSVSEVALSDRLTLPLDLALSDGWAREPLYATLTVEQSRYAHDLRFVDSLSPHDRIAWVGRLASPLTDHGIAVDERPARRTAEVLRLAPVTLTARGALLVQGRIESGGVTLGLVRDGDWYCRVAVTEPGRFVAIVPVSAAGRYEPAIAHDAPKDRWRDRFVIARFGAIDPDAQ
jgi:hypothetical protein